MDVGWKPPHSCGGEERFSAPQKASPLTKRFSAGARASGSLRDSRSHPLSRSERPDGVHLSYDRMASFLAPYQNQQALQVARDLDAKMEALLTPAAC